MDTKKILIVDDERDTLSVLEKMLVSKGYSVVTADNGNDAVILAKSERPNLIILDILMPGMDGPEIAMRLKENSKTTDIPVMFLTCLYAKAEEAEAGHMVGSEIIFAKPYDAEELVSTIEKLICRNRDASFGNRPASQSSSRRTCTN